MANMHPLRRVIKPQRRILEFDWYEIWSYRDLMWLLVRRDLVSNYKQTVLGPAWFLIQPLLTTVMFTIIFGHIAKIDTENTPPFLFYMCSTLMWNYFQACMNGVGTSLTANANLLRKVYFPRLITPLSIVIVGLAQLTLNALLFLGFYSYYIARGYFSVELNAWLLALPLVIVQCAIISLGVGLWFAALTTRYRDLRFTIGFISQLWMYATPIVYPLTMVPEKWHWIVMLNPMASVIEQTRLAFLGIGTMPPQYAITGWIISIAVAASGLIIFNKAQRSFVDTI